MILQKAGSQKSEVRIKNGAALVILIF